MSNTPLKNKILLTTALAGTAFFGYGRRAYGACYQVSGATYLCAGTNSVPQTVTYVGATVSTLPGFSVNTSGGTAGLTVGGYGGNVSFTDNNASTITVAGPGHSGLYLYASGNGGNGGSLTANTNSIINSTGNGISSVSGINGPLSITFSGSINSSNGYGISASNLYASGDLTINSSGTISSNAAGITAHNNSTGALSITTTGQTNSSNGIGINAVSYGSGIIINSAGINSHGDGIYTYGKTGGGGATSITANGNITSTNGVGIHAIAPNFTGEPITITTNSGANVTGNTSGISVNDSGNLTITTNSNITGTNNNGIAVSGGIYGLGSAAFNVNVNSGTVTGGAIGIYSNNGYGSANIITAMGSTVIGGNDGINSTGSSYHASNSVTANGIVTGTNGFGIFVSGAYATVNTGADSVVTAHSNGVTVSGANTAYATVNGTVTSAIGVGVNAGTNYGNIGLTIGSTGNIQGATDGINTNTSVYGGSITVATAAGSNVIGGTNGIEVGFSRGLGTVTANGNVTGTTGSGITVSGENGFNITTGANSIVSGHNFGIKLLTGTVSGTGYGSGGAYSITTNGNVVSSNGQGIYAHSTNIFGTNFAITSNNVTAQGTAINAYNAGTGATSVTVNGAINSANQDGIRVSNGLYYYNSGTYSYVTAHHGTNMSVTTGVNSSIAAHGIGIYAANYGSGALTITANGSVASTNGTAISAKNSRYGTNLTVSSNGITAANDAIDAFNQGSGATSITANEDITSTNGQGIAAKNYGTALTITTAGITSQGDGINAQNIDVYGSGPLSITANGNIHSAAGAGIVAVNDGTDLTITAAGVTANSDGINARNYGNGALSITANGDISSANSNAIETNSRGTTTDIVTALNTNINGHHDGIYVGYAKGPITVTTNGDVTGVTGRGIFVNSYYTTSAITVQNGSQISGVTGILIVGTGSSTMVLDGTVDPVSVTGTGGTAIQFSTTGNSLTLDGQVAINGNVIGSGTDTLNLNSATVTGGSVVTGIDAVNITGTNLFVGDIIAPGATINETNASLHVNGNLTVGTFNVGTGAQFGGNNILTANLVIGSGGTLAPGNSVGTVNVVGNAVFNNGSVFDVEVDSSGADRLNTTGTTTINAGSTLNLIPLGKNTGGSDIIIAADGGLTGTFSTVNTNGLIASVIYNTNQALLLTTSPIMSNAQGLASLQTAELFNDNLMSTAEDYAFQTGNHYWVKGLYRNNDRSDNGVYSGFINNEYGAATGGEGQINQNWKVGFSIADLANDTRIENNLGKIEGNGGFASVYGTYTHPLATNWDMFSTLGIMGAVINDDTSRVVNNSGVTAHAEGSSDVYQAGTLFAIGARTKVINNSWYIQPKVGVDYIHTFADGYDEKGGGAAAVSIDSYNFGMVRPNVGVSLYNDKGISIPETNVKMKPTLNLGAYREFAVGNRDVEGHFSNDTVFGYTLDQQDQTFGTAGAGVNFDISKGVTGFVNYQYSKSDNESRNDANIGLSVEF